MKDNEETNFPVHHQSNTGSSPLSSHEIDGVRKEKERLTAVSFSFSFQRLIVFPKLYFSFLIVAREAANKKVMHEFPFFSWPLSWRSRKKNS